MSLCAIKRFLGSLVLATLGILLQGCGLVYDAVELIHPLTRDELSSICSRARLRVGISVEPFRPFVFPAVYTDEGIRAAVEIRRRHPGVAVLVLSQYVEERYAADLLSGPVSGVGYLLKDRVMHTGEFLIALRRVATGGSAVDAEVVSQLVGRSRHRTELAALTPRERDVLTGMAEGLSNNGIAEQLVVSPGAVEKHISNMFLKLGLEPEDRAHRRVLAVLTYLRETGAA